MKEIINISVQEPYKILCFFNNGEQKILDLEKVLNPEQKYARKIFIKKVFKQAKIGTFGEIYWDGIAEMKDLNGNIIPCEYDICPDFAYLNSSYIEENEKLNS